MEGYSAQHLRKDLLSGIIVGVIAIPLAMAFAIASGVKPEYGLYTTIIAGIIISLFGGSRYQIGGPTGAFVPILMGIVLTYGYKNLLIAGMMAGVLLFLMGVLKFGNFIKYIPHPVTIGFTSGIAVIIFSGQIANFLGLTGLKKHENFLDNMIEIVKHLSSFNIYCFITSIICLITIIIFIKYFPKVPGSLLGLIFSGVIATILFPGKVETISSTFGMIPNKLPKFQIPDLSFITMEHLIGPALIIAMLGSIESLLSAVVADKMTGLEHNSNKELIGQGLANIVAPLFGGIPATGAIARTATNIKNGATSPVSGVIHGLVVLGILLLLAPYASLIPLSSMAPILMLVAWNMSEKEEFKKVLLKKSLDSIVLVVTFFLTVFLNLTTGVGVGLFLTFLINLSRKKN
jgi:SulP family sulfate permease